MAIKVSFPHFVEVIWQRELGIVSNAVATISKPVEPIAPRERASFQRGEQVETPAHIDWVKRRHRPPGIRVDRGGEYAIVIYR